MGGQGAFAHLQKIVKNIFREISFNKFGHFGGKYHVKFGNFVRQKCLAPSPKKLTELLRLYIDIITKLSNMNK